jgi:hypothetical protein
LKWTIEDTTNSTKVTGTSYNTINEVLDGYWLVTLKLFLSLEQYWIQYLTAESNQNILVEIYLLNHDFIGIAPYTHDSSLNFANTLALKKSFDDISIKVPLNYLFIAS